MSTLSGFKSRDYHITIPHASKISCGLIKSLVASLADLDMSVALRAGCKEKHIRTNARDEWPLLALRSSRNVKSMHMTGVSLFDRFQL